MKYYKENGVNPLASCLPMLIQLPVFISLFYMLRTDLKKKICGPEIAHALHLNPKFSLSNTGCSKLLPHSGSFLFIPDITAKATGAALIVLVVLYMASMFTTSYFSTAAMERNQRILMLGMPLFFTVIIYRYPAGLLLYWITTNLTQIPLQYFVRRRVASSPPVVVGGPSANGRDAKATPRLGKAKTAAAVVAVRSEPPPQAPRKRKKPRSGRRR
jgi:YidC/Oxa1 family membrane protein insertase